MSETEKKRRGTSREAILEAAEIVFAEHGFDGARVDSIAHLSGYDKKLLFRYYGEKLSLYTEVLKRTDQDLTALQTQILAPMLEQTEGSIPTQRMRSFLVIVVQTLFDYLLEHPRFLRILTWEMAEGWQTYKQIASHLQSEDREPFDRLFQQGEQTGLLRSSFTPLIQLAMITPICLSYLASLPLYQVMLPEEDLSSREALFRAREYLVTLIVAGMLVDPQASGEAS